MASKPWIIKQLGGRKREVMLAGWSAPHGRPRQRALVEDGVQMREQSTRYPDADASTPPTRHLFGGDFDDWNLEGRFRARYEGGEDAVRERVETLKAMVLEGQTVDMTWGDTLSIRGLLKRFTPGREGVGEVTWKLTVLVDIDNFASATTRRGAPSPANPTDAASKVQALLGPLGGATSSPAAAGVKTSLLDAIDESISSVTGALGQYVTAANALDSFESALSADVQRLKAGLHQTKTATLTFLRTLEATQQDLGDAAVFFKRDSATDEIAWSAQRTDMTASAYKALAILAEEDRRAEIALAGTVGTTTVAQAGETWEALSTRLYGGPSEADRLRQANGAKYGDRPIAGQTIQVPPL